MKKLLILPILFLAGFALAQIPKVNQGNPPWQVQSNNANMSTETTLSSLNSKVTTCDTGAVTVSSSALPTGAANQTKQDTGNSSLASIDGKVTACNTGAVVISSSALPSGAATSVKQPALGTAGVSSTDVISVQGITSMTPLKTDGSGFTQPISGSVNQGTANTATNGWPVKITDGTNILPIFNTGDSSAGNTAILIAGEFGTNEAKHLAATDDGFLSVSLEATNTTIPITASSLPLPTGASTEATLAFLPLAQASTTSGQKGPMCQAAVTTAAPSYTTAQTNPLSMQTDGSLRTAVTNTVTVGTHAVTGSGTFTVDSEFPAAATIAADGVTPTVPGAAAYGFLKTPGANTWDRHYSVVNGMDTTGTGIAASGILAQLDDVSTGTVTENQFSTVRLSSRRALLVEGVASGTAIPISAASLPTHAVTVASGGIASGAIASGALASGSIASGAVASGAVASGAYASGSISDGAVVTLGAKTDAKSTATDATSITAMQVLKQISASVQAPPTIGVEDAGETAGGSLQMAGSVRRDTPASSAGTTGDNASINTDAVGRTWVNPWGVALASILMDRVADTAGTSAAFTNCGALASNRNYITSVTVYNSSATSGFVDLRDGTAGSVFWTLPAPSGGGVTMNFSPPLRQATVNTALAYDVSAALSTVYISVSCFRSTE